MRPVLLEMNGFASFRDSETVNFADADFFVLVGPTGSGKSTVIDALVFALYGTVPRWADKRMVGYGLAPTANRGTVRLIFDVDGRRYVAARELRRASHGGVQIKNASLERFHDPNATGALDDATDVLASDSGVSAGVERLLGLTYDHFCQCVVLPQGAFAEFLHAKGSERRAILLKLLGADLYTDIGRAANTKASLAAGRVTMFTEQLTELADATEDAERAAAQREHDLTALTGTVTAALPQLAVGQAALEEAARAHLRTESEHAQLAAVRLPDGVAELDERITAADRVADTARACEQDALTADTAARDRVAAAPPRGPLEQARRQHAEHRRVVAALPTARTAAATASSELEHAVSACQAATAELDVARDDRTAAEQRKDRAAATVRQLTDHLALLDGVAIPAGLDALDEKIRAAREGHQRAAAALTAAEQADDNARTAVDTAPRRAPLDKALEDRAALTAATAALEPLTVEQRSADEVHERALAELTAASSALGAALTAREDAAVAHRAAALRPHLSVGDACPVCEQTVTTLPPAAHAPELDAATAAVTAAQARVTTAKEAERTTGRAADTAAAQVTAAGTTVTQLQAQLVGQPDEQTVRATLSQIEQLAAQARAAADTLRTARTQAARALDERQRAEAQADDVRTALGAARDPLFALGAPTLDDSDLLQAWTSLTSWVRQQAADRRHALTAAQADALDAAATLTGAQATFKRADAQALRRRTAETDATAARERARADLDALERALRELTVALADAPSDDEADAQLAELDALADAAKTTDAALRVARSARADAEDAVTALARENAAAWQRLRATRDPLFPLGAPELPEGQPALTGWTVLLEWTSAQAAARAAALPSAQEAVTAATQTLDDATKELLNELAAHNVGVPPGELTGTAPVAVASALTQARSDRKSISERRAKAATLRHQLERAQDEEQVARMLGQLLRSDKFPEWLEAAALDTLVLDASTRLFELSGGQFELTHRKGDFFVVDHADADSLRSVRTLSGGETFQASLSLALALSSQLSTLAASGAARLDSIFLDEGFGSLDPDTLEVVAGTLETLASGERMVGVVTHVAALAERIPVRFTVSRDQRTSRVVRESA